MQNKARTMVYLQKVEGRNPDIEQSPYVVNNSLPCALLPKRTSVNIKAFLQIHRKLLRKKIIEKTFHSSLNQLATQPNDTPRGFRGTSTTSYRFHKTCREGSERIRTQNFFIDSPSTTITYPSK